MNFNDLAIEPLSDDLLESVAGATSSGASCCSCQNCSNGPKEAEAIAG